MKSLTAFRKKHNCDNCSLIGLEFKFTEGSEWFDCAWHNLNSDKGNKQKEFFRIERV